MYSVTITDEDERHRGRLADFRSKGWMMFRTVLRDPGPGGDEFTVTNVEGYYDIRVAYVRPRLSGARHKDNGALKETGFAVTRITHGNYSELLDKDGPTLRRFVHDPVVVEFSQELGAPPERDHARGDGRFNHMDENGKQGFATLGLFTEWTIEIPADKDDNNGLDLSKVDRVTVEFGITARLPGSPGS